MKNTYFTPPEVIRCATCDRKQVDHCHNCERCIDPTELKLHGDECSEEWLCPGCLTW